SALTEQTVHSAPTIVDGAVYLGSENGRVYAFDLGVRRSRHRSARVRRVR
ncbi:MAG: hypothetical protein FJ189_09445, partial [Gammaproteobacteria bacterium]|nr:hypothetical protein [Gammaproteobacteria bacterium]